MRLRFDTATGRLRLDSELFRHLAGWAAGTQPPGPVLKEFRAAGVLQGAAPHPALAAGLHAVRVPQCRLRVDLRDRRGRAETGECWVCDEPVAALLLELPDGLAEFITLDPAFLPVALARVVELGPRPRAAAQPLPIPRGLPDRLTAAEPDVRAVAADELAAMAPDAATRDAVVALSSGLRRDWAIRSAWQAPTGGELAGRMVRVLDSSAGLWLIQPQPGTGVGAELLCPTTPTVVWRCLTRLLPDDHELAPATGRPGPADRA